MNNRRKNRIFLASVNGLFYLIAAMVGASEADLIGDAFRQTRSINLLKIYGVVILVGLIIPLVRDKWRGRHLRWRTAEICSHIIVYLACAAAFTHNFLFLWLLWTVGLTVIILQLVREDLIPIPTMQHVAKPVKLLNWFAFIMLFTCGSCALITSNGLFWGLAAIIVAPYILIGSYMILRTIRSKRRAKRARLENGASQETTAPQI